MQVTLDPRFKNSSRAQEAEDILRSCVHCGFCTATCPTYQELGDERDGPRGRIYLIKALLEGDKVTEKTRTHLDRCLTCRSCETTCPSDVQYGKLVDIGRNIIEEEQQRPVVERGVRWCLRKILPYEKRFGSLLKLGQLLRPVMPKAIKNKIPPRQQHSVWPQLKHKRIMLTLAGCAQPSATPNVNAAAARVLDKLAITLQEVPGAGCCGAVSQHLGAPEEALGFMRRNIDVWWPAVESGAETIVSTASGCGVMLSEYGYYLRDDADYKDKAQKISAMVKDLSEVLINEDLAKLNVKDSSKKTAVHCPCTLQHGMKQPDLVDKILKKCGLPLARTKEKHLCCGSAGTYSLLQPEMSQKLLTRKLNALNGDNSEQVVEQIVTANIGCQLHLQTRSEVPVMHWIELLDQK